MNMGTVSNYTLDFSEISMRDLPRVGGKNASLGEMISQLADAGIRVPGGFATTAFAFREFLAHNDLARRIAARLQALDVDDVAALAKAGASLTLATVIVNACSANRPPASATRRTMG